MPTAKPIIEIMLVTKKESSESWLITAAKPVATEMDTSARISGTPAATIAPKTTIRINNVIGRPKYSAIFRSSSAMVLNSWLDEAAPTEYTSKPSLRSLLTASRYCWA